MLSLLCFASLHLGSSEEGKDLIKEMAAATIHNISLKRAVLGPGILTCLLSLTKGTYQHTRHAIHTPY